MTYVYFPQNPDWWWNVFRLITEAAYDGADFGEICRTIDHMQPGNLEDWYHGWKAIAEHAEESAGEELRRGHTETAEKGYFRAFSYYRQAQSLLTRGDDRKVPTFVKAVECFQRGVELSTCIESVKVPYEGDTLNGYVVHRQDERPNRGPGLIWFGGADSPAEELYFQGALEAARRGFTCLVVSGPGQGLTLYVKKIYARPDYEKAYEAAADYMETRPEVDPKRLAIMGSSMGGYYCPRAAAFERRAKACVAYSAVYDVKTDVYDYFPPIRSTIQWLIGAEDDSEAREKLKDYTLKGVADKITCPLLIVHGVDDYVVSVKAAHRLYGEARCPKELKTWKAGHMVREYHKEVLCYMFDWLSDRLK